MLKRKLETNIKKKMRVMIKNDPVSCCLYVSPWLKVTYSVVIQRELETMSA